MTTSPEIQAAVKELLKECSLGARQLGSLLGYPASFFNVLCRDSRTKTTLDLMTQLKKQSPYLFKTKYEFTVPADHPAYISVRTALVNLMVKDPSRYNSTLVARVMRTDMMSRYPVTEYRLRRAAQALGVELPFIIM